MNSKRLFLAYPNGRCFAQHVVCHPVSGITKLIAEYLNLGSPEDSTGHSL